MDLAQQVALWNNMVTEALDHQAQALKTTKNMFFTEHQGQVTPIPEDTVNTIVDEVLREMKEVFPVKDQERYLQQLITFNLDILFLVGGVFTAIDHWRKHYVNLPEDNANDTIKSIIGLSLILTIKTTMEAFHDQSLDIQGTITHAQTTDHSN